MARKKVRRKDAMGLSASQARLLSITARLGNNELHSQQIANSKVRLADQTQKASQEYIQALDSTKLMYTTYDANGEATQVAFSPAVMYEFSELKNQYGIANTSGQLLVSGTDAKNFAASSSMPKFVEMYGVELVENPEYITSLKMIYGEDYEKFFDMTSNTPRFTITVGGTAPTAWAAQPNKGMTATQYNDWASKAGSIQVQGGEAGDYGNLIYELKNPPAYPGSLRPEPPEPNPDDYAALRDFVEVIKNNDCHKNYTEPYGYNCFMHVLADMLGVGSHTTSNGVTYNIVTGSGWNWNTANHPTLEGLADVQEIIKNTQSISEPSKTIYQRIVDFLWEAHDTYDGSGTGGKATPENLAIYYDILDNDLANAPVSEYEIAVEEWELDHAQWELEKAEWDRKWNEVFAWGAGIGNLNTIYEEALENLPTPEIPNPEDPKTEWYINLWHRMNGASDFKTNEGTIGKYYKELEENLFNSSDWLKFALEHGVVALEQVTFVEQGELGTGLEQAKWKRTVYTSAADISEVEDQVAIARAEAEYTKKLNEIESKDKQYDIDIKKLDTEHNALQTEYESIQNVIQKNVDRSFKAFS